VIVALGTTIKRYWLGIDIDEKKTTEQEKKTE